MNISPPTMINIKIETLAAMMSKALLCFSFLTDTTHSHNNIII